ncbi:MOSC domain-containing protein [Actinocatenispora rupis]|uniref:Molybdenum cofactor biosysynthesis protein n=1 Tax=Actinocatenispora rupis TaxID=519421 RepID=A0A8J3J9I2_9ACTN|nr:MOSC N-terminal beta barrel domain-containing protein [Actinocatenispora rupis]GID10713.1 molybdenum cofactor biosysynthesis protein [Actinocatenispora rupis]
MQVSELYVYPVKSTRGTAVAVAEVEPWGLRGDRRWLVVLPGGEFLTARENDRMLTVTATETPDGLTLAAPGRPTVRVPYPVGGAAVAVAVTRLDTVRAAGPVADDWLTAVLGEPVRLGWLDDPRRRTVSAEHGGEPGDPLNLSDAGPLLLATTASLDRLNHWVSETRAERGEPAGDPLDMRRFRPNVVVDGVAEPFAEDTWTSVRIGDVDFRVSELCDRCVLTTIDPDTRAHGHEPIRTLARHRRWDRHVWFGVRLVPRSPGTLRRGAPVVVG